MDLLWNLGIGLLVASAIPLLVPIRHGTAVILVVLGVSGALLAACAARALGMVAHTRDGVGLLLSAIGALAVPIAYGLIGKRVA